MTFTQKYFIVAPLIVRLCLPRIGNKYIFWTEEMTFWPLFINLQDFSNFFMKIYRLIHKKHFLKNVLFIILNYVKLISILNEFLVFFRE